MKKGEKMNNTNIRDEIISILSEVTGAEPISITGDKMLEDLEIDSILFIQLVIKCETNFNIQFDDDMLLISNFSKIDEFIEYIEKKHEIALDKE